MLFCNVLNNISFPVKEKLIRSNQVLLCRHFRIHRYVAALFNSLTYDNLDIELKILYMFYILKK
jgi:hypothetical protein